MDKILKGAKPAEFPEEQAMKFEIVINLNTAKQIGLPILPNVLARADRVIQWPSNLKSKIQNLKLRGDSAKRGASG